MMTSDRSGEDERGDRVKKVLDDATERDDVATRRDAVSDERARVADLQAFTDTTGSLRRPGREASGSPRPSRRRERP
jgi:hypothetical protein